MTYQCWECKEIFTDDEVEEMTYQSRPQTLTTPAEYTTTCKCGGDDCMDEIDLCQTCGEQPLVSGLDECLDCFKAYCESEDDMESYYEFIEETGEAA